MNFEADRAVALREGFLHAGLDARAMLTVMMTAAGGRPLRVLLLDTCGEEGSVALAQGERVLAVRRMVARAASAELLDAIADVLAEAGWSVASLDAVGVVRGPGSFTGVRVGLAAAEALCEARGIAMAAVSRLDVLCSKADDAMATMVLAAGRGEVFVQLPDGVDTLVRVEEFAADAVVVCETKLVETWSHARLINIDAGDALPVVLRCLAEGGSDPAAVDALYLRADAAMYRAGTSA